MANHVIKIGRENIFYNTIDIIIDLARGEESFRFVQSASEECLWLLFGIFLIFSEACITLFLFFYRLKIPNHREEMSDLQKIAVIPSQRLLSKLIQLWQKRCIVDDAASQ